jgi:hypothetical protein
MLAHVFRTPFRQQQVDNIPKPYTQWIRISASTDSNNNEGLPLRIFSTA